MVNDNLADMASTLFQKMFLSSSDKNQWPTGTFSNFIMSTVGGDWGQESPTGNYTQEVSCIRGTDIPSLNAGSISSAPTRYILPKNFRSKRIKADDLVVEISGGSPVQATGRIALVPQQVLDYRGDKLICSNFCRVVTVDNIYLQYFLQYWLYLYRAGRMFDYENSSTGLKNFDFSSFVKNEPIHIPPRDIVQEYNRAVRPMYTQLFSNGFEIETLEETQRHILPQIMHHGFSSR
jgi:type I restriction enzyme S subunit